MSKEYQLIAHSCDDENYERIVGTYSSREEAEKHRFIWECVGPYEFVGMYQIKELA